MKYRHKIYQLFSKKLNVPKRILSKVYNNRVTLKEYIEYELYGKIPLECLLEEDRKILDKFGLEKILSLDWELFNISFYIHDEIDLNLILKNIPKEVEDINEILYELLKTKIRPSQYSSKMKELYPNRIFLIKEDDTKDIKQKKERYNEGDVSLENILKDWELYKDKKLDYCLSNDNKNSYKITEEELRNFKNKYGNLVSLIIKHNDIYKFIYEHNILKTEVEQKEFIKKFTDDLIKEKKWSYQNIELSNEEYMEVFKYSSLEEFLKNIQSSYGTYLLEELNTLSPNYIFKTEFPFELFKDPGVLGFVGIYGLKNTIEFDRECGNFFSKNNFRILKIMYETYMHYAHGAQDGLKFYIIQPRDENGNLYEIPYRKEDFYETIRRMIVNGPTNYDYAEKAPNYSDLQGEFRKRYQEMFLSEDAPQELQDAFYTKKINPRMIKEHPEYREYLRGKNLHSCFEKESARIQLESGYFKYINLYEHLSKNLTFDEMMEYIKEYADIIEMYSNLVYRDKVHIDFIIDTEPTYESIMSSTDELFRKMIIEKKSPYTPNVPKHLKENLSGLFMREDAPKELLEMFYSRKIDRRIFFHHPEYREYFNNIDPEVICRPLLVWSSKPNGGSRQINLIEDIKEKFGHSAIDIVLCYGEYLEKMSETNELLYFNHSSNYTKDDLQDELDKQVYELITSGKTKYDEYMSESFKNKHPNMFLSDNVEQEIKDKFYNREFKKEDFENNPELLDKFGDTNIICGLSPEYAWLIPMFKNSKNANENRLKVLDEFLEIKDVSLQNAFKEYMADCMDEIDLEKIKYIAEVMKRLSLSNSKEMITFRKELAVQILNSQDPLSSLDKIESIFIKNNIPTVGKIYSCFEILHPNLEKFDFSPSSTTSPVLKKNSNEGRKVIIFSDLIKASFGSNNRSVNKYLSNIDVSHSLYENIINGNIKYDELTIEEQNELKQFLKHLITLYNNTKKGKQDLNGFEETSDVVKDITKIKKLLSPNGTLDYNLADRVINMFCHFAGIKTLKEAKDYIENKIKNAELRNIEASKRDMVLEEGDYIKGIQGGITYLGSILQNGSVSKEYLGSSAGSDATPLDTDISRIMKSEGTNRDKILSTEAATYGNIWFVLKNDDRFQVTRGEEQVEEQDIKRSDKLEVFLTGVVGKGHYGIRTGFSSSDINYIVVEKYDEKVAMEIVINGFYIPIADKDGKIIFTYEDYLYLKSKMNGLTYYGEKGYRFSHNLVNPEIEEIASKLDESNVEVAKKRKRINELIYSALKEFNLELKTTIDGDLTSGVVELIDTGSTGRGTNKPGDGDFDFIMRVDKKILSEQAKMEEIKSALLKKFNKIGAGGIISTGDFRLKDVNIEPNVNVDIDITFVEKTDQVTYSTDMCLQDRLKTIYETDKEKYKYVIANILLAKKVLKEANVYKPYRSDRTQGGLGGVGVENWILQNGGSFKDAAKSFLDASRGKTFEEFKEIYKIWDFGENHLALKNLNYPHDNFVNNMSKEGYEKMQKALREFLLLYEENITYTSKRK